MSLKKHLYLFALFILFTNIVSFSPVKSQQDIIDLLEEDAGESPGEETGTIQDNPLKLVGDESQKNEQPSAEPPPAPKPEPTPEPQPEPESKPEPEAQPEPQPEPQSPPPSATRPVKKRGIFSLKKSYEIKEKSEDELTELNARARKERNEIREKEKLERAELYLKEKKERYALKEKQRTEKTELRKRQAARKEEVKKVRNERLDAKGQINDRLNEIRKVQWRDRHIEIITDENDPLYILDGDVVKAKTEYLKIKDIDYNYKLLLQNQTPKVINSVLIIWERRIPFIETQTIAKKFRIAKPFIPYEKRKVGFNEVNSRREGEIYRVKIAKVLFEDGSQWKNPLIRDSELEQ